MQNLPVSLFGSVMGLCGLAIAWKLGSMLFAFSTLPYEIIGIIALLAFLSMCVGYIIKIIKYPQSVKDEFTNPLTKSFFGAFIISLLLLPVLIEPYWHSLAFVIWIIGVLLMFVFACYMFGFWLNNTQDISSLTPAWIIPIVGTLDIPLAMYLFYDDIGFLRDDIGILAISLGLFFTIVLFVFISARVVFSSALPQKLRPTMMILVAPFSVGFSAYTEIVGRIDIFAMSLFFLGFFVFLTLLPQMFSLYKCCPFRVTWWAISFPLSALLVSVLKVAIFFNKPYYKFIGLLFLMMFSLVFIWLIYRTLSGIFRGELKNLV